MPKVSVVILTKNEEEMLPLVLASVKWADEVLVVDSFSDDRTVEIAKEAGARVLQHKFEGFAAQYNWANEQAEGPWILAVDADEVVDDQLRQSVQALLQEEPPLDMYEVLRDSLFFGQRTRCRSWRDERGVRLFRKGALKYDGSVHSTLDTGDRQRGEVSGRLIHHTFRTLPQYLVKMRHYAHLFAEDAFRKNRIRPGIARAIGSSLWRFFHEYAIRGAYRDGRNGVLLAAIAMQYTFEKYIYLWDLHRREKERKEKGGEEKR